MSLGSGWRPGAGNGCVVVTERVRSHLWFIHVSGIRHVSGKPEKPAHELHFLSPSTLRLHPTFLLFSPLQQHLEGGGGGWAWWFTPSSALSYFRRKLQRDQPGGNTQSLSNGAVTSTSWKKENRRGKERANREGNNSARRRRRRSFSSAPNLRLNSMFPASNTSTLRDAEQQTFMTVKDVGWFLFCSNFSTF